MFFDFFQAFYYIALIVSAMLSFWLLPKSKQGYRWIAILVLVTFLNELLSTIMLFYFKQSNNIIYHFFTPVEFGIYTIAFSKFLGKGFWRKIVIASFFVLVIAEILNTIYFQSLGQSNTNIMILVGIFLVFFSLVLFAKIKDDRIYDNLLNEGVFWINSAVLIYYSFNILVWGFHSIQIYNLVRPPMFIYSINQVFSALLYLVFTYAIYLSWSNHSNKSLKITHGA
jgi:hypothetical protein